MAPFFAFSLLLLCLVPLVSLKTLGKKSNFKISGPKSHFDKIAIVGAGPSGIHMALSLKEKGFKHVEILEKTDHVGGKVNSVFHRGAYHEMGAIYIYENNVMRLAQKYLPGKLTRFAGPSVWMDGKLEPIPYDQYFNSLFKEIHNVTNPLVVGEMFEEAKQRFINLHRYIFDNYRFGIMPASDKLHLIRGSTLDFLLRNNLIALIRSFEYYLSFYGYGTITEVSAHYALMYVHPRLMNGFGYIKNDSRVMISGYQSLWKAIVEKEELNVAYNVHIRKVNRVFNAEKPYVEICKSIGIEHETCDSYDFLIWSPEMKTSLPIFDNGIEKEIELFSRATTLYETTAVVDCLNEKRSNSPTDYWIDNIYSKQENAISAQIDSYGQAQHQDGISYRNGSYRTGDDTRKIRTVVTYQFGSEVMSVREIKKKIMSHMKSLNGENIYINRVKQWRYFPHYSIKDMEEGILWKILEEQGKHMMWYIGSSVAFECVPSVIAYNQLILKYYDESSLDM